MERLERFFRIRRLLGARAFVTRAQFLADLEVSPATFKRDLEYMRDRMRLPIVWDAPRQAYRLGLSSSGVERHELPGLWFSSTEVQALLTVDHLLSSLEPGLLGELLNPFRHRIRRLVGSGDHSLEEVSRRIRIRSMAARFDDGSTSAELNYFEGSHAYRETYREPEGAERRRSLEALLRLFREYLLDSEQELFVEDLFDGPEADRVPLVMGGE